MGLTRCYKTEVFYIYILIIITCVYLLFHILFSNSNLSIRNVQLHFAPSSKFKRQFLNVSVVFQLPKPLQVRRTCLRAAVGKLHVDVVVGAGERVRRSLFLDAVF